MIITRSLEGIADFTLCVANTGSCTGNEMDNPIRGSGIDTLTTVLFGGGSPLLAANSNVGFGRQGGNSNTQESTSMSYLKLLLYLGAIGIFGAGLIKKSLTR